MSSGLGDLPPVRVVRSRLPSLYDLRSPMKGNRGGNYAGTCASRRGLTVALVAALALLTYRAYRSTMPYGWA